MPLHQFQKETAFYEDIYKFLKEEAKEYEKPRIGLSGGHAPVPLYKKMNEEKAPEFTRAHYFQVDERYVPMFNPNSNMGMLLQVFDEDFHISGWDTAFNDREEAHEDYETVIKEEAMDIIILGLGADGHIASLFPHSAVLNAGGVLASSENLRGPVRDRVTMTLPFIMKAKTLILLVKGPEDKKGLEKMQDPATLVQDCPAASLFDHKNLHIFVSEE